MDHRIHTFPHTLTSRASLETISACLCLWVRKHTSYAQRKPSRALRKAANYAQKSPSWREWRHSQPLQRHTSPICGRSGRPNLKDSAHHMIITQKEMGSGRLCGAVCILLEGGRRWEPTGWMCVIIPIYYMWVILWMLMLLRCNAPGQFVSQHSQSDTTPTIKPHQASLTPIPAPDRDHLTCLNVIGWFDTRQKAVRRGLLNKGFEFI